MLDVRRIRQNPQELRDMLQNRNKDAAIVDDFLARDEQRRKYSENRQQNDPQPFFPLSIRFRFLLKFTVDRNLFVFVKFFSVVILKKLNYKTNLIIITNEKKNFEIV